MIYWCAHVSVDTVLRDTLHSMLPVGLNGTSCPCFARIGVVHQQGDTTVVMCLSVPVHVQLGMEVVSDKTFRHSMDGQALHLMQCDFGWRVAMCVFSVLGPTQSVTVVSSPPASSNPDERFVHCVGMPVLLTENWDISQVVQTVV